MILKAATVFTGLAPWIKIVSISTLVIGVWWGLTWYNNKQRNIGAQKERGRLFSLLQVESEKGWEEKRVGIEEREAAVILDQEELDKASAALDIEKQLVKSDRRSLSREITFAGAEFARRLGNVGTEVSIVSDDDLVPDIHRALADLRQFDAAGNIVSFEGRPGSEATAPGN